MELKDLTVQEWFTLVEGTGGAIGAVVTAQPSGMSGFDKEMTAAHEAMKELAGQEWKSAFMAAFKDEILAGTREQDPEYLKIAEDHKKDIQNSIAANRLSPVLRVQTSPELV